LTKVRGKKRKVELSKNAKKAQCFDLQSIAPFIGKT
jgi:hypothetical protein